MQVTGGFISALLLTAVPVCEVGRLTVDVRAPTQGLLAVHVVGVQGGRGLFLMSIISLSGGPSP